MIEILLASPQSYPLRRAIRRTRAAEMSYTAGDTQEALTLKAALGILSPQ